MNKQTLSLRDAVVMLSAVGYRHSLQITDQLFQESVLTFIQNIVDYVVRQNFLKDASYQEVATLVWIFALEPEKLICPKVLWGQLEERLEDLANEEVNSFHDKKNVISTIRIAKSLVQLEMTLERSPQFWRLFISMIRNENFLKIAGRLSMADFSNLLFASSHVELLDKTYEWPLLLQAFSQKI